MRLLWLSGAAAALVLGGTVTAWTASSSTKSPVVKTTLESRTVRLDNITDWSTFITDFKRAVERRDRRALRSAMDRPFRYTFDRTPGGDPRDEAIELWDRGGTKIWACLDQVLAKGQRDDPEVPGLMVSPPAWVEDGKYIGYRAGFMKVKGNWRWIWFVTGDY
jgi:hypothetical protein